MLNYKQKKMMIDAVAQKMMRRAQDGEEPYSLDEVSGILKIIKGKGSIQKLYMGMHQSTYIALENGWKPREEFVDESLEAYDNNKDLSAYIVACELKYSSHKNGLEAIVRIQNALPKVFLGSNINMNTYLKV